MPDHTKGVLQSESPIGLISRAGINAGRFYFSDLIHKLLKGLAWRLGNVGALETAVVTNNMCCMAAPQVDAWGSARASEQKTAQGRNGTGVTRVILPSFPC